MSTRKRLCVRQEGKDGKVYWKEVGVGWEGEKGLTLSLHLFDKPIFVFDAEEKQQEAPRQQRSRYGNSGAGNSAKHTAGDDDSDLPF